jgi:hypothetical protein
VKSIISAPLVPDARASDGDPAFPGKRRDGRKRRGGPEDIGSSKWTSALLLLPFSPPIVPAAKADGFSI